MWLYFNSKGQLIKSLEHGNPARVGSTKFEIFAVFENIDSDTLLNDYNATIKLRKPDLFGTTYPILLMSNASAVFTTMSGESNIAPFENNKTYYGFLFDFNEIVDNNNNHGSSTDITDDTQIALLDTQGLWEATITLIKDGFDVQGVATFNVGGTGSEEEVEIPYNVITNQLINEINRRALKDQVIIAVTSISDLEGHLDDYNLGQLFYDKSLQATFELVYNEDNDERELVQKDVVKIDSELSLSSTNPVENRVVSEELKNVREVAEGKCRTFVLSYNDTLADVKTSIQNHDAKVYDIDGNDITQKVVNGFYDDLPCYNSEFNSQENVIVAVHSNSYIITRNTSPIIPAYAVPNNFVFIGKVGTDTYKYASLGDVFLVIETDVPDRWCGGNGSAYYKLETIQIVLDQYEVKTNKVTSLSSSSTNTEYPSAKCVYDEFVGVKNDISDIEELIPAQASSENQLADKNFVNSSIATNTAYFLGTYDIVSDLGLPTSATTTQVETAIATVLASQGIEVSNNDYVFVAYPDAIEPGQYTRFDRYKFNSEDNQWDYEYTLNNSSFTSAQWAAINSGVTDTIVNVTIPSKADKVSNAVDGDFAGLDANGNLTDSGYSSANMLNVINGAEIISQTLTQAQYDLITNGKPTLIKGQVAGTTLNNALILGVYYPAVATIICICVNGQNLSETFYVSSSTKVITVDNSNVQRLKLNNIAELNGKILPAYPSSNTVPQVLTIDASQHSLLWTDKNNFASSLLPDTNNSYDIGSSGYTWKDLYLSGTINKNLSGYGLILPNTSLFGANKTIATTDDITSAVSRVYKIQGTATVSELNSLTITSGMNGYVYNVSDSGTLNQGSVSVVVGDNVAIIWDEDNNTFSWDKLSGTVDLSNYVTTTGLATELLNYVPIIRTIAGIGLSADISAQSLTDALSYMNNTNDLAYVMED